MGTTTSKNKGNTENYGKGSLQKAISPVQLYYIDVMKYEQTLSYRTEMMIGALEGYKMKGAYRLASSTEKLT